MHTQIYGHQILKVDLDVLQLPENTFS